MRRRGTLRGFSGAIKCTQIASTYLRIPLYIIGIDHVHDSRLVQSRIILIWRGKRKVRGVGFIRRVIQVTI
jgi:hypothetical protein